MALARETFAKMDSVGQARMTALIDRPDLRTEDLLIEPTLWAGPALVRDGHMHEGWVATRLGLNALRTTQRRTEVLKY